MKILSKYNIQVQLVLFITIVFVTCGVAGVFSVYQKISKDRNQEQISAVREALLNFERLNLDNFETYDYHEVFRNLNQYQFPAHVAYVAITDRAGNIVTERWMASFSDDPVLLKNLREEMLTNRRMGVGVDETVSSNGYLHFTTPVASGEDTIFARIHLFLDFSQIKRQSFRYGIMLIGLLVLCLALILATVIFISRRVMKPIAKFHSYLQGSKGNAALLFEGYHDFPVDVRNLVIQYNTLISNLKSSEDVLRSQTVDAAIGKTASQVAHDIRSPLSSLQAALMLLREQCAGNKDAADSLNLLQLSSKRLDNIANGLLAKYKGEESVSQTFSIHEVLDELVGELHASSLGQGTEFKKQYHTAALYVTGDKTGVARAIGNIIKNALEAMQGNPDNRPRQLSIATTLALPPHPAPLPEGEGVIIRIQDTGPGIPADKIPLILQGGHTEGKADGHGIGTKVIKEVVETHKGHLAIESQVGVGTTFIITLPATVQNDETIVTIPHAGSGVICVIDDEPSLREQWRLTLRGMGVTAKVFTCWEDFDAAKASVAPDGTFIVDYHFDNSEVDGLEVIRRLKARGFDKFILATAEYWKPAIKSAAQKLGVTLCPKPLPKVVLESSHLPQGEGTTGKTVLVIDDDDCIRMTWSAVKKNLGIATLHSFPSMEAAIQAKVDPRTCNLCFIDKNIEGSQFDGARMLEYLKQNGAKTVVLATGEMEADIRKDPKFDAIDGIIQMKIPSSLDEFLN